MDDGTARRGASADGRGSSEAVRLLVVDDEPHVLTVLARIGQLLGFEVRTASDGQAALASLAEEGPVDLLVTDIDMPRMGGLALIETLMESDPWLPAVVLTGEGSLESAVQALRLGVEDYLLKPIDVDALERRLEEIVERRISPRKRAAAEPTTSGSYPAGEDRALVGGSPTMREAIRRIEQVKLIDSNVLIQGPSGTGKELVAQAIHWNGPRMHRPFIGINCGAVAENLLESTLFGHVKGAFTGADRSRAGAFEAAGGGTLFLDEITEMAAGLQVKLLRVLAERRFSPVGTVAEQQMEARIIAATNRDLPDALATGALREDLFYRLNVIPIQLTALRERPEDIPPLLRYVNDRMAARFGCAPKVVAPRAMRRILAYPWPGNVRELGNFVEQLYAFDTPSPVETLPSPVGDVEPPSASGPIPTLVAAEHALILRALDATGGNKTEAARILGTTRQRILRKLRQYGHH